MQQIPDHLHKHVLIRTDAGGGTRGFVDWVTRRRLKCSIGFNLTDDLCAAILALPERVWECAYEALGGGLYTVAGAVRKGSWKLGSQWQGQAGEAFDEYLFRWSMGIGGLGDAAIEAVGLGPEDPPADVGAGIYTAYKIYKIVQKIVNGIRIIVKIYDGIQKAIDGIHKGIRAIMDAINSPMPTLGSLVGDVEQRGFEFEKSGGWSSTLGAARIGMIPAT